MADPPFLRLIAQIRDIGPDLARLILTHVHENLGNIRLTVQIPEDMTHPRFSLWNETGHQEAIRKYAAMMNERIRFSTLTSARWGYLQ